MLRLRKENFDTHAGPDTRDARQLVPGRSWAAWSRALGLLLPPLDVADLGCGEGYLTVEAARWASQRHRRRSLRRRARRAPRRSRARRRVSNVTWKKGELEKLPLEDGAVDVALLSQALHHAARPGARASPKRRASLRPGGRVLVLDLRAHDEDVGARRSSAIAGSASPTTSSGGMLTARRASATCSVARRRAQGRRSVHRADRHRARSATPDARKHTQDPNHEGP